MMQTIEYNKTKWYNVSEPTEKDLKFLKENFDFHTLALDDVLSYHQRPKIDEYKNHMFFVIHLPIMENRLKIREVDFFVGGNYVITATTKKYELLENLFKETGNSPERQKKLFDKNSVFLFYHILDALTENLFPILNALGTEIDGINRSLTKQKSERIIGKINLMRRNLIIFQTLIKPELSILSEMEGGKIKFLGNKMNIYWGDILDHIRKASDQLDDYRELLEGLAITSESLIFHRTNEIIKILTIISVIVLPLTLIASIYGMNIPLPIQRSALALPILIVLMVAMVGGMLAYFKIRRWF